MTNAPLLGRLADELDALRGALETLGATLCADAATVTRHAVELQAFDELGQRAGAIAAVLRSDDPAAAARDVPLAALAARLADDAALLPRGQAKLEAVG